MPRKYHTAVDTASLSLQRTRPSAVTRSPALPRGGSEKKPNSYGRCSLLIPVCAFGLFFRRGDVVIRARRGPTAVPAVMLLPWRGVTATTTWMAKVLLLLLLLPLVPPPQPPLDDLGVLAAQIHLSVSWIANQPARRVGWFAISAGNMVCALPSCAMVIHPSASNSKWRVSLQRMPLQTRLWAGGVDWPSVTCQMFHYPPTDGPSLGTRSKGGLLSCGKYLFRDGSWILPEDGRVFLWGWSVLHLSLWVWS